MRVGDPVTVRRVLKTGTGTITSGTMVLRIAVSDGAGGFLYLQADDSLSPSTHDYLSLAPVDGDWMGGYDIPPSLQGRGVHEIAFHSTYGAQTCNYEVEGDIIIEPAAEF